MLSTIDEALVEEARAGDRVAFETLLEPLISPAYRLDDALATTEVVVMEVLAGARDDAHHDRLRRVVLGRCQVLTGHGLADYEEAAATYRLCRSRGTTVRRLTDCLIAAVAIRAAVPLLHADQDFDQIARHCRLQVA